VLAAHTRLGGGVIEAVHAVGGPGARSTACCAIVRRSAAACL